MIIEVLSPSNSDDDLIVKKDLYEEYGVAEYWIISPMSKKVWIYSLKNLKGHDQYCGVTEKARYVKNGMTKNSCYLF